MIWQIRPNKLNHPNFHTFSASFRTTRLKVVRDRLMLTVSTLRSDLFSNWYFSDPARSIKLRVPANKINCVRNYLNTQEINHTTEYSPWHLIFFDWLTPSNLICVIEWDLEDCSFMTVAATKRLFCAFAKNFNKTSSEVTTSTW